MEDDVRYNARLILGALDYVVGGQVGVAANLPAAVQGAGFEPHGPDYNKAVKFLIEEGAIKEGPRGEEIASGDHPGNTLYWEMTEQGKALLQELRLNRGPDYP